MVESNFSLPRNAYVPILKAKKAELDALAGTGPENLVPLLEVTEPSKIHDQVSKAWKGRPSPLWIHLFDFSEDEDQNFGETVTSVFSPMLNEFPVVPVLTQTEEPETLKAYADVAATDDRGAVLRIDVEDLVDVGLDSQGDIESTLEALDLSPAEVDLVIDGGFLDGPSTIRSAVVTQGLNALPTTEWRSMVVAFSAFPQELGKVAKKDAVTVIPRVEAQSYDSVKKSSQLPLTYADYAVGTPTYGTAPFSPIPNIRYAVGREWMIHRGSARKNPTPQYRKLASEITQSPYYDGADFSPGDRKIQQVASENGGPGNATTHLQIGMSRHFHVVLDRLSTLGEP